MGGPSLSAVVRPASVMARLPQASLGHSATQLSPPYIPPRIPPQRMQHTRVKQIAACRAEGFSGERFLKWRNVTANAF